MRTPTSFEFAISHIARIICLETSHRRKPANSKSKPRRSYSHSKQETNADVLFRSLTRQCHDYIFGRTDSAGL